MARFVALVLLLVLAVPAAADRLVPTDGPTFRSVGSETIAFDGFVYFAADDAVHGNELWRTDGTAVGTTLVKDFRAGDASTNSNPLNFVVAGNRLFFRVGNSDDGNKINVVYFIQKGTTAPVPVLDGGQQVQAAILGAVGDKALLRVLVNANSNYTMKSLGGAGTTVTTVTGPASLDNLSDEPVATVGNTAYFASAGGPTSAYELWKTDGTSASLVKDVRPGADGSNPHDFVATGNRAYFVADDGSHGRELWVTDGTEPGTTMLLDQNPLTQNTSIEHTVANGNVLYYTATDPVTGQEPWRTDGTTAGTRVVKDITPGTAGASQALYAYKAGFLLLRTGSIWYSDGTEAGTTVVGTVDNDGYGPDLVTVLGDRAYFRGGLSPFGGVVWRTDSTAGGTFGLTAGAFDGAATAGNPFAQGLTALGTKLVFFGRYPHAAGDGIPIDWVRVAAIDTAQPDDVRTATVAPAITGTAAVGQTLTVSTGTWTRGPNTYAYQWLRNGTAIANQTATTYKLAAADAGTAISARVTASGVGGPNVVSADAPAVAVTGAVATATPTASPSPTPTPAATLTVTKKPKVTGATKVGSTLEVKLPTFAQPGVKLAFSWYADGKKIKKQTKPKLKLKKSLKGKKISVKIKVTKTGFGPVTLQVKLGKVRKG